MYRDSRDHLFACIARIHRRAAQLLQDSGGPGADEGDELDAEAEAIAARIELRLPLLADVFGLSPLAMRALLCLLAAEYDPFIRLLQRALQRDSGRPWLEVGTIAELLELPLHEVPDLAALFSSDGGGELVRSALVLVDDAGGAEVPTVAVRVKVSDPIAAWVAGVDRLGPAARLVTPRPVLADALVAPAVTEAAVVRVRRALLAHEPLVLEIGGPAGCGKRFFAEGLAADLGRPLLVVDLSLVDRQRLRQTLAEARRDAALTGALLCLARVDSLLPTAAPPPPDESMGPPPAVQLHTLPPPLVRFFAELSEVVIATVDDPMPLLQRVAPAVIHVKVPFPSPLQRMQLLGKALARAGRPLAADVELEVTARRFALTPERIDVAARVAVELACQRDPGPNRVITDANLVQACRTQLSHDLLSVATRVTATHRWEDMVIPVEAYEALCELIGYVKNAERVYDKWGFGGRHSLAQGLSALLAGPPGTGKTMCASVLARELDMELFQVDLSRVVSKWIGETEKNLAKIFDEAERSHAIILFDEADSLFAKRTEVKSSVNRYANLEVNFLLQRMERFSGVTILTTNFEDSIDVAFKRRLTFRIRFEKPDAAARASLWSKVFPPQCELGADVSAERLGQLYEMSGANIRNAAVRAAFLAATQGRPLDMTVCMLAAERECREMGLLVRSHVADADSDGAPAVIAPELPVESALTLAARAAAARGNGAGRARLVPITHRR